jgi:hypothetical protein
MGHCNRPRAGTSLMQERAVLSRIGPP